MLTENIKTIVDFTIGDGHLCDYAHDQDNDKGKNGAGFKLEHSINQYEYLMHKSIILSSFGYSFTERHNRKYLPKTNKVYETVSCLFKPHQDFRTAKKHTYNKRIKTIDKHLLSCLDARSLAYWFMDDGSGSKSKVAKAKVNNVRYTYIYPIPKIYCYCIQTDCFTVPEVLLIIDWLKEKFDINANLTIQRTYPVIRIRNIEEKNKFRSAIQPFIIPSMYYKIDGAHTFVGMEYESVQRESTERENSSSYEDDAMVHSDF